MDYSEHLDRAISETPDEKAGDGRFAVPDPVVRREGNVTVYENFAETHDRVAREPAHLLSYLQSAFATSATIDESGRARFTGSFKQARVADALDDYVKTFVHCDECGSPDTRFVTEQDETMLKCDACGVLSVTPDV